MIESMIEWEAGMRGNRRTTAPRRDGQTLLELIAATTIIATALVPALRMMRDSLRVSRDLETAGFMTSLCVSTLEREAARSVVSWDTLGSTGDFASEGRPDLRFQVTKSDDGSAGGIPNLLMAARVLVWHDRNANGAFDDGEPSVTFATKLCKTMGFQDEAK